MAFCEYIDTPPDGWLSVDFAIGPSS